jgi:enoyl-CoA hydratase/carnithine racemase
MVEIKLDGPGKNALGTRMMEGLLARVRAAGDAPLVFTGSGDAFSAGLDLKEVVSLDVPRMTAYLALLDELMTTVFLHPAPTVALVNGHAIAGGTVLTLACDWRVAARAPKARLGLNEVALGLRYPPRILSIVQYRVPPQHLETVVLAAGLHAPDAALALGLLDEVSDDAPAAARTRMDALAALPRGAYAAAKRELRAPHVTPSPEAETRFQNEALPEWTRPELKERLAKVLSRS